MPSASLLATRTARFNPFAVGQPGVILDGDQLQRYGVGGPIPEWPDLSGRGASPAQATPGRRPTAQVRGGYWCASFDGVDDNLDAPAGAPFLWVPGTPWTVFAVLQTSGDNIWMADVTGFNHQLRIGASGNIISEYDGTNHPLSGVLPIARADMSLVEYSQIPVVNTAWYAQNGLLIGSSGNITATITLNRLGTASGGGAAWTLGYIFYVVAYPFYLTDGQRRYVDQGLCQRYQLPHLGG